MFWTCHVTTDWFHLEKYGSLVSPEKVIKQYQQYIRIKIGTSIGLKKLFLDTIAISNT